MDNGASSYRRFLSGENEGMSELIREYKDGLTLYINSFVNNICIAEELMEETFVKLVVKKPKFSGRSTFKTWLYAIARHVSYDYLKRSSRGQTIPIDELYDISDEEDIEHSYIRQEDKIILHRVIQKLNPDYSQVLYLIYFEDFDNAETAEIMNKSKRQIENLLYRAKCALKSELEKEGFEYEGL